MPLQESGEMYLESIYMLSKSNDAIHAIDICAYMGYSKPSVSRAMGILKKEGYITVDEDDHIHLTESGISVAKTMYRRHTLLTDFLTSLGVDGETASTDACKIEHVISEKSFDAIEKYLQKQS